MIGLVKRKLLKSPKKNSRVIDEIPDPSVTPPLPSSSTPLSGSSKDPLETSVQAEEEAEPVMQASRSCDDVDPENNRIGKYLIVSKLSETEATVFLAENIMRGGKKHQVILKKQPLMSPRTHRYVPRSRLETIIMKELNSEFHKHNEGQKYIVKLIGEVASTRLNEHYIVMEYCECGSLIDHLNEINMAYPLDVSRRWMLDIMLAISFMHSLGIAHRDIKIDNIFLHNNGHRIVCKVGDFGLSAIMQPDMQDNSTVGSPRNVAPDIVRTIYDRMGHHKKDPFAVDIWALGVVVYLLVEMAFPFEVDPPDSPMEASMRAANDANGVLTRLETESLYQKIYVNARRPREQHLDDLLLNDFINAMLEYDDTKRAPIDALLLHAFMQQPVRPLKLFDFAHVRDVGSKRRHRHYHKSSRR